MTDQEIAAAQAAADQAAADKAAADKSTADQAPVQAPPVAAPAPSPVTGTLVVDGQTVRVKFGVSIPGMGEHTKDELLQNPEVVAYLIEIGSGAIEIIKNS